MLLEFKVKNFKSFTEEAVLSMLAAPKQKGLDYSLCIENNKGKKIKGLCSSVVYGPNASGKTNLIGAMDVLRAIVLRGNIKNTEETMSANPASVSLELIPNHQTDEKKPVDFVIEFTEARMDIRYELSIWLGAFLETSAKRKVLREVLKINDKMLFERAEELVIDNLETIKDYLDDSLYRDMPGLMDIARRSLNPEELFLANGFKVMISADFVKLITDWFANKFMVICRADSMQLVKRFSDPQKKTIYVETTTNEAAKVFGISSNDLGYVVTGKDSETKLCSIFKDPEGRQKYAMLAEAFESYGTIRFITIFPLVVKAILTGSVLVVDEFDASIHPMALMSIINVFHNDEINVNHAQLIFNTHNPIFLNSNIFRRDEIKFVERDEETGHSEIYALSDFGTAGDNGVRQHGDYMKNYFVGRYGAVKDIDFTPIFEKILSQEVTE